MNRAMIRNMTIEEFESYLETVAVTDLEKSCLSKFRLISDIYEAEIDNLEKELSDSEDRREELEAENTDLEIDNLEKRIKIKNIRRRTRR